MPTNVVQLHRYPAVVLEKADQEMWLLWCVTSDKIMEGRSKTQPISMFLNKDMTDVLSKLLLVGWKIKERYDNVEII